MDPRDEFENSHIQLEREYVLEIASLRSKIDSQSKELDELRYKLDTACATANYRLKYLHAACCVENTPSDGEAKLASDIGTELCSLRKEHAAALSWKKDRIENQDGQYDNLNTAELALIDAIDKVTT